MELVGRWRYGVGGRWRYGVSGEMEVWSWWEGGREVMRKKL